MREAEVEVEEVPNYQIFLKFAKRTAKQKQKE